MKHKFLALAAAVVLPIAGAAAAATFTQNIDVNAGAGSAASQVLMSGQDVEFIFTAQQDLRVNILGITATGTNFGTDLEGLTFGVGGPNDQFAAGEISIMEDTATGETFEGFNAFIAAGDSFSFFFNLDDSVNPVATGLSFATNTVAPSPVPLPASALLLGTAFLGGGTLLRRRKKS